MPDLLEAASVEKDYPSLYQPSGRNRFPPDIQAEHQLQAYFRMRDVLGQMVNHIAGRELGADYVTIPNDWTDEMIERFDTARHMAFPNPVTHLHR